MPAMSGAFPWRYSHWANGAFTPVEGVIIAEGLVRLHINGQEWAALMCTPHELELLALGLLRSEGIIRQRSDVRLIQPCPSLTCVDVWLRDAAAPLPTGRPILTSGCGGGLTFDDLSSRVAPLASSLQIEPAQVLTAMQQLMAAATLYHSTRGVHTSALSDGQRLVAVAEDVGRHNTIDRLWGYCLQHDVDPRDHLLLATGRISSEMLNKAAKMGVPVVISHTSPTSLSVRLAEEWRISLIGYVRGSNFNCYANAWRILSASV